MNLRDVVMTVDGSYVVVDTSLVGKSVFATMVFRSNASGIISGAAYSKPLDGVLYRSSKDAKKGTCGDA